MRFRFVLFAMAMNELELFLFLFFVSIGTTCLEEKLVTRENYEVAL